MDFCVQCSYFYFLNSFEKLADVKREDRMTSCPHCGLLLGHLHINYILKYGAFRHNIFKKFKYLLALPELMYHYKTVGKCVSTARSLYPCGSSLVQIHVCNPDNGKCHKL